MARQDIQADPVYGDLKTTDRLTGKLIRDFLFLDDVQGEDNENYCHGEITVPPGFETKYSDRSGIHVQIPYIPVFKELKIRFRIENGNGSPEYMLNKTDNRVWFTVYRGMETGGKHPIRMSEFQELNENGNFNLILKDGYLTVFSGDETDFEIKASLEQNKVFLLKAFRGNLYQHPTTGVGLVDFLHGNPENTTLAVRLRQEFENDGMIIDNAAMNSTSGELYLDVKEKNG
jgi:hypothetical protein